MRRVLIIGAGIAGLSSAILLARRGWLVEVIERAEKLDEIGAGIQLSPNAMKALAAVGIDKAIRQSAVAPARAVIRHWKSGHALFSEALGEDIARRYGAPYLHIHRADLVYALERAAEAADVSFRFGQTVAVVGRAGDVTLESGERLSGDLVLGADGVRSVTRGALFGPEDPRFTGQVAWRALVPADEALRQAVPREATVWAGPGAHLVTYYVRGGDLLNIVAVEEQSGWREEGWHHAGDAAELRARFADWHGSAQLVLGAVREARRWALYDRAPLASWAAGHVALIGDACHPMLPFMAQGAAMGLEDAVVLAGLLGAPGEADIDAALARYEAIRKPRTSRMQARSRANADLYHFSGGLGDFRRRAMFAVARAVPPVASAQLGWIYSHDPVASLSPGAEASV